MLLVQWEDRVPVSESQTCYWCNGRTEFQSVSLRRVIGAVGGQSSSQ